MPLVASMLADGIRKFSDSSFAGFEKFPETEDEAAKFWAEAVKTYFAGLSVPPPIGPRHIAAASTFQAQLKGFGAPGAAPGILPAAFAAAAGVLAGMSVPVALPPPAPLVIPPLQPGDNAALAATQLAMAVDLWMKLGMWGPPPSPPVPPWT